MKSKQKPKTTLHRITALLLALLLTAATLSPAMTASAAGTTDTTEGDRDGGGHQVSPDEGDESSQRPTNDPTLKPIITENEDGSRTLKIIQKITTVNAKNDYVSSNKTTFEICGKGKFVIVSYMDNAHNGGDDGLNVTAFILSDKSFSNHMYTESHDYGDRGTGEYKGVYYSYLSGQVNMNPLSSVSLSGFANMKHVTLSSGETFETILKRAIDNGSIDLSKDSYKDIGEGKAIYNKDLDFSSISADYKVKYTIEKDSDGHWNFVTPDEAGIQFDWINRSDIDSAYVKFNIYGEYYDSFWSTSYTNTYVTLTCERKNDLTYLCNQKEMISLAKEKCNGSKGYGFVVNYIYVQAFANIDGTMCRSRIYKFDSDLVSDYGNADSEDDEWMPEVTGGDSMPEDYEPDPDNPDPEKTEPSPDKDDDTVVDTPVDGEDVIINDDTTYLEAFKQFINVMKQGIAYLGDFPLMVSSVFSFIPSIFLVFIGVGFAVALLLRFLGR